MFYARNLFYTTFLSTLNCTTSNQLHIIIIIIVRKNHKLVGLIRFESQRIQDQVVHVPQMRHNANQYCPKQPKCNFIDNNYCSCSCIPVVSIGQNSCFLSYFSSTGLCSDYTTSFYLHHCFVTMEREKSQMSTMISTTIVVTQFVFSAHTLR